MTIDRAIEILNPEHREHYESIDPVNEACRMGMEALERTRWIPCSERMPKNDTTVLVYRPSMVKKVMVSYFYNFFCYGRFDVHGEEVITHWMSLPKPPEEVFPC